MQCAMLQAQAGLCVRPCMQLWAAVAPTTNMALQLASGGQGVKVMHGGNSSGCQHSTTSGKPRVVTTARAICWT